MPPRTNKPKAPSTPAPPRNVPQQPATPSANPTTPSSAPFVDGKKPNAGGDADAKQGLVSFAPQPNPIGDLHQPTYYFRWFLQSDTVQSVGSDSPGITIAETGATGLNLTDVRIETFIGPNSQTKNATATNITMTLIEPYGARLPDVLYTAASKLKIKNYHKAPWMLELKIMGYDGNGNRIVLGTQAWKWQMMLLDIDTKISELGATHTVTAMPLQEVALDNQYCMLTEAVAVQGKTVGEILTKLGEALNESAANRYGDGFITYKFEDRPYTGTSAIPSPMAHSILTGAPEQDDKRNQEAGHYSPGTDIPSIVDSLMATSETAVKMARLSRELDTEANTANGDPEVKDIKEVTSIMHRIDTDVKIVGWNPIVQDYCREITYIIKPYETLRLMTSKENAKANLGSDNFQRRKAQHAVDKSYLTKVYDYIFTGTNTEVQNFDIQLKFNWAVCVPMLQGRVHYGSVTLPQKINETLWERDKWEKIESGRQTLTDINNFLDANGDKIKDSSEKDLERTRDKLSASIVKASRTARIESAEIIKKSNDDFNNSRKTLTSFSGFGEKMLADIEADDGNLASMPISIMDGADRPSLPVEFGTSSNWHEGRSIYGALLNQMYGAVDGNLQNIQLQIRGDPYWLGPTGYQINDRSKEGDANSANFMNGEHMFLFRFKFPLGFNKSTNSVDLAKGDLGQTDTYNGFYAAIKVTHNFSNGVFTQELDGTRIPGWSISKVLNISGDTDK